MDNQCIEQTQKRDKVPDIEKLVLDLGESALIAEKYSETELVVYIQDKTTDCITQDIVTVRRTAEDGTVLNNAVECLVWSDEQSEDYTHKFRINRYMEET